MLDEIEFEIEGELNDELDGEIDNIIDETKTIFRQTREGNVVFGADMDDEAEALAVFCFCKGFDITQVDASIYFVFIADCLLLQVVDAKICDHQRSSVANF